MRFFVLSNLLLCFTCVVHAQLYLDTITTNQSQHEIESLKSIVSQKEKLKRITLKIELAESKEDPQDKEKLLLEAADLSLEMGSFQQSLSFCNSALITNKQTLRESMRAEAYHLKGLNLMYAGQSDSALYYLNRANLVFSRLEDHYMATRARLNKAVLCQRKGLYNEALEVYLEVIHHTSPVIQDSFSRSPTLFDNIAACYRGLMEFEKANKYSEMSNRNNSKVSPKEECQNLIDQANQFKQHGDTANMFSAFQQAIEIAEFEGLEDSQGIIFFYLGDYFYTSRAYEDAVEYFRRSNNIALTTQNSKLKVLTYVGIINTYISVEEQTWVLKKTDFASAYELIRALEKLCAIDDFSTNQYITEALYHYYHNRGDYRNSLKYYQISKQNMDSIYSLERSMEIAKVEFKYTLERKEKEAQLLEDNIERLKQEKKLLRINSLLWMAVIFFILLSIILIVSIINKRHKREKELTKKELEMKKKELQNFTQIILEKNKTIEEFEHQMLPDNGNEDLEFLRKRDDLAKQKILTEEDWEKFKLLFSEVYPDFLYRIESKFSSLTEAEKRLFILIKLEFDGKQTAQILGISMESVRKSRYRLKKKLALEPETDLAGFIKIFS